MKVIIAGSRAIVDKWTIVEAVGATDWIIDEVVSGGARGVDRLGEEWAVIHNIPVKQFIADWIVSQKAFKELAMEYGSQLGFSPKEVGQLGMAKKMDVLNCKHDPSHGTNADSDFLKVHAPALKKKIQSEKK